MMQPNALLSWSDIETLFTNLNTARQKFKFSTVSTPTKGLAKANLASTIEDYIEDMTTNKYVGSIASIDDSIIPSIDDLIVPLSFTRFNETISTIQNTCFFDSSNYTNNFSGYNSSVRTSNNSGFFSGNHSGFFSSNHSGFFSSNNSGFFSSNNSFNSTWCTSFRSSNFTSNNSGFNSSVRTSNFLHNSMNFTSFFGGN